MATAKANRFPPPEAYRAAARRLARWQRACVICPQACKVDRTRGQRGVCRAAANVAPVNISQLHHGEEPPISGHRGSGTVFFAGCTMACRFCQNSSISQEGWGVEVGPDLLAEDFMALWLAGAHNLNLVTPTPHLPVILEALAIVRQAGCPLPVVYNTSGYERAATIRQLDGLVEIYLPDFKYADDQVALRLSSAPGYVGHARAALAEMHRQVGDLQLDDDGVATRGVLVRHLVLPENLSGTDRVLPELVKICGPEVAVSLMSQYFPAYKADQTPGIGRTISRAEYRAALAALDRAGIENGYVQGLSSASDEYVPEFQD